MVSISVAITIASLTWSVGLFVGLFTARFVNKKDCQTMQSKLWNRIDAIQNILAGGKMTFELRPIKQDDE